MIRPEDVPNEMIVAAARVLNERTAKECNVDAGDQWRWYSEGFKDDARAAIAAAINASGCVLVPEALIWDLLEALDQVRASRSRGEEDWNSLNAADERMRDLLDDAAGQGEG